MRTPEVVLNSAGPVIVHSNDYSLVTTAKPAHAGEVLTLFASGLVPHAPLSTLGSYSRQTPRSWQIRPLMCS